MYCAKCGMEFSGQGRFCVSCGALRTDSQVQPPTGSEFEARVLVTQPKNAGWLALKVFLAVVVVGMAGYVALQLMFVRILVRSIWMASALAFGAAFIALIVQKWRKDEGAVKGAGIAWATVGLLIVGCLGNLTLIGLIKAYQSKDASTEAARNLDGAKEIAESETYSTTVLDPSATSLPIHFRGNDPGEISRTLVNLYPQEQKSEFETTAAYKDRLTKQHEVPLIGTLRLDSVYAFQVEPKDTAYSMKTTYDADKELLELEVQSHPITDFDGEIDENKLDSGSIILKTGPDPTRSGEAAKMFPGNFEIVYAKRGTFPSFNSKEEIVEDSLIGTRVHMTPGVAAMTKENIRAIALCKLAEPYFLAGLSRKGATLGSQDRFYLYVKLLEVWFYDWQNGQIISKVRSLRK